MKVRGYFFRKLELRYWKKWMDTVSVMFSEEKKSLLNASYPHCPKSRGDCRVIPWHEYEREFPVGLISVCNFIRLTLEI